MALTDFEFDTEGSVTMGLSTTAPIAGDSSLEYKTVAAGGVGIAGLATGQEVTESARVATLIKSTEWSALDYQQTGAVGLYGMMQTSFSRTADSYVLRARREGTKPDIYSSMEICRGNMDNLKDVDLSTGITLGSFTFPSPIELDDVFSMTFEFQYDSGNDLVVLRGWYGTSTTWVENKRFSDIDLDVPDISVFDSSAGKYTNGQSMGICHDSNGAHDVRTIFDSTAFNVV